MPTSPYTRFLFGHLIPGSTLVCAVLFLVDVPTDEGYRISLLEWCLDSDRAFLYVVALGLVGSAFLGSLVQAARTLVVDAWALRRRARWTSWRRRASSSPARGACSRVTC